MEDCKHETEEWFDCPDHEEWCFATRCEDCGDLLYQDCKEEETRDPRTYNVTFVLEHAVVYTRIDSSNYDKDFIIDLAKDKLVDMVGIDIDKLRIVDIEVEGIN